MRGPVLLSSIIIWWILGGWAQATAFYCDRSLVTSGETTGEVLQKCGEPIARSEWLEDIIETFLVEPPQGDRHTRGRFPPGRTPPDKSRRGRIYEQEISRRIQVLHEEWTYNFGPHRLIHVLHFENGRLVRVQTRGYGS